MLRGHAGSAGEDPDPEWGETSIKWSNAGFDFPASGPEHAGLRYGQPWPEGEDPWRLSGDPGLRPVVEPVVASAVDVDPMRRRRALARFLDWLLAGTLSAAICWPWAWHALSAEMAGAGTRLLWDATARAGTQDPVHGLLTEVHHVRLILTRTLSAQVALTVAYEWVMLALTGRTIGKLLLGMRVTTTRPTPARDRSRWRNLPGLARALWRSLGAIVPGGTTVSALVVAATGSLTSLMVSAAAFLTLSVDAAFGLRTGRCLHDRIAGTAVARVRAAE